MKKIYLKPAFAAMTMDENFPIAYSTVEISDDPVVNVEADVKGNDWNIWSDAE